MTRAHIINRSTLPGLVGVTIVVAICLAALLATEVQRQADDHPLDPVLGDQLGDRARLRRFDNRQTSTAKAA